MNHSPWKFPKGTAIFSEEFRSWLQTGKYYQWAVDIKDEQLAAVLWAVGEYGYRSRFILELLRKHSHFDPFCQARALLALEVLADFTRGRFIDVDQYCAKVPQAIESAHEVFRRSIADKIIKILETAQHKPLVKECSSLLASQPDVLCGVSQTMPRESVIADYETNLSGSSPEDAQACGLSTLLDALRDSPLEFIRTYSVSREPPSYVIFTDRDSAAMVGILKIPR